MSRVWVYGCSFTQFGSSITHNWGKENSFPDLISKELGVEVFNRGFAGATNFEIIRNFLDDYDQIQPDDTVIIHWTHVDRKWTSKRSYFVTNVDHEDKETRDLTRLYFGEFYEDSEVLLNLFTYHQTVKSLFKGKYLFGFADWTSVLKGEYYDIMSQEDGYVSEEGDSMTEYCKSFGPQMTFKCLHPNHKGHEYLSKKFLDKM